MLTRTVRHCCSAGGGHGLPHCCGASCSASRGVTQSSPQYAVTPASELALACMLPCHWCGSGARLPWRGGSQGVHRYSGLAVLLGAGEPGPLMRPGLGATVAAPSAMDGSPSTTSSSALSLPGAGTRRTRRAATVAKVRSCPGPCPVGQAAGLLVQPRRCAAVQAEMVTASPEDRVSSLTPGRGRGLNAQPPRLPSLPTNPTRRGREGADPLCACILARPRPTTQPAAATAVAPTAA